MTKYLLFFSYRFLQRSLPDAEVVIITDHILQLAPAAPTEVASSKPSV